MNRWCWSPMSIARWWARGMGRGKASITSRSQRRSRDWPYAPERFSREPATSAGRRRANSARSRSDSSTAAPGWPPSKRGIRWIQCRDCACYTYQSRCSSELIKILEIDLLKRTAAPKGCRGSGPRAKAFKCVGKKNAGAKQAQTRGYGLDHRK